MMPYQYPTWPQFTSPEENTLLRSAAKILAFITAFVSALMLPLHFMVLVMSLDPGFGFYFLLTLLVLIVKCAGVVNFFIYLYSISSLSKIVFLTAEAVIGITWLVLIIKVIGVSGSFFAIFTNPFVLDLGLFLLTNSLMLLLTFYDPTSDYFHYYPMQGIRMVHPGRYMKEIPMTYVMDNAMVN